MNEYSAVQRNFQERWKSLRQRFLGRRLKFSPYPHVFVDFEPVYGLVRRAPTILLEVLWEHTRSRHDKRSKTKEKRAREKAGRATFGSCVALSKSFAKHNRSTSGSKGGRRTRRYQLRTHM